MTTRITKNDLKFVLSKTNEALERVAVSMAADNDTIPWCGGTISMTPDNMQYIKDRARLDLSFAYGGVLIVREYCQDPIGKRGTKEEVLDRLNVIRKTLDIVRGF